MRFVLFFCFFCGFAANAQLTVEYDSLTLDYSVQGSLDSVDYNSGELPAAIDGGYTVLSPAGLSLNRLVHNYTSLAHQDFNAWRQMKFSALPYLGFSYSFGSKGAQFLRAKYYHVFSDKLIANIEYDRVLSNGYVRNTAFTRHNVHAQLERKAKRYSFQLSGAYRSDSLIHAGGIQSTADSLIDQVGVEFVPVWKDNASSRAQRGQIRLKNYINLTGDSIRQLGLVTEHSYQILNRRYMDADTLFALFDTVYIDSFETFDRYNWASIENFGGVYVSKQGFYLDGMIGHRYWEFKNLDNVFDTTEIDVRSNLRWQRTNMLITNTFNFNVIGGFNALTNRTAIRYQFDQFTVNAYLNLLNEAPEAVKRSYRGNTYQYDTENIQLQNELHLGGNIGYQFGKRGHQLEAFGQYTGMTNVYLFNDSIWERSSSSLSGLEVGLKSKWKFGKLNIHPTAIVASQSSGYLPAFQGYLRVFLKTKVFEAQKMELTLGVDASYSSKFNHRTYNSVLDNFNWYETAGETPALTNLHFFSAFSISTFRFFLRYENIGYFWSDKAVQVQKNYPLAGPRLRVGITWDFFN